LKDPTLNGTLKVRTLRRDTPLHTGFADGITATTNDTIFLNSFTEKSLKFQSKPTMLPSAGQYHKIPEIPDRYFKVSTTFSASRVAHSVVSGYGLDDRAIEVRSPAEAKGFLL
jgi:hypothetical protein